MYFNIRATFGPSSSAADPERRKCNAPVLRRSQRSIAYLKVPLKGVVDLRASPPAPAEQHPCLPLVAATLPAASSLKGGAAGEQGRVLPKELRR